MNKIGIFQTLVNKYKDAKQKIKNKADFKKALLEAVSDGKLTKEEIDNLDQLKQTLGLTDQEVKGMRVDIFAAAFAVAKSDAQVTKEEEQELVGIQKYLGLADSDIEPTKKELARLRLINEIQLGNIPTMQVKNLLVAKNENVYWVEPSILIEEKVLRRRYEGGSSGFSFRIMKGVSYRVGSSRGYLVNETGNVATSDGELIITSKRVIFRGDKKSFATKIGNILDTRLFTDGFQFSENNKTKPRMVGFKSGNNQEIIGGILSYAINHYDGKR